MRALSKESKRVFSGRLSALFSILLLLTFLLVGCGNSKLELNSNWRDREITVDGKNADWLGVFSFRNISDTLRFRIIALKNWKLTVIIGQQI